MSVYFILLWFVGNQSERSHIKKWKKNKKNPLPDKSCFPHCKLSRVSWHVEAPSSNSRMDLKTSRELGHGGPLHLLKAATITSTALLGFGTPSSASSYNLQWLQWTQSRPSVLEPHRCTLECWTHWEQSPPPQSPPLVLLRLLRPRYPSPFANRTHPCNSKDFRVMGIWPCKKIRPSSKREWRFARGTSEKKREDKETLALISMGFRWRLFLDGAWSLSRVFKRRTYGQYRFWKFVIFKPTSTPFVRCDSPASPSFTLLLLLLLFSLFFPLSS